ncbi:MAG: hypothetical protein F4W89_02555 [Acidobacteria bacterium]|nr:hypothetical protein [Acidobacteriota bacterium]
MPRSCEATHPAIGALPNDWRAGAGPDCQWSRRSGLRSISTRQHGGHGPTGRRKRLAVTTLRLMNASALSWIGLPMSAVAEVLDVLRRMLDERGLRWFVFGAQAVAVRGAPRATQDIDITVQVERTGIQALVRSLESAGLRHRHPDLADDLLARGAVVPLVHSSGMEVDLVVAGSGLETMALDRASRVAIDGVEVPVAHATDLAVMKVLAGRGKDLDDLRSLLAAGEVDLEEARDLLGQFEEALGRGDLLARLEEAVAAIE